MSNSKVKKEYEYRSLIPTGDLVDSGTGEVVNVEGVDLLERKPTGFCDFNYRRYAFLNTTAFKDLHSRHKPIEMALLTVLIASIEQTFNICMQSSEQAHSTKSIAGLLGETPQSTRRKLKSLITGGVLYHGRVNHYKARPLGKVYVLNPHIAKVGRRKLAVLAELFDPIEYSDNWQTDVKPSAI
jgi:hypothetical protein